MYLCSWVQRQISRRISKAQTKESGDKKNMARFWFVRSGLQLQRSLLRHHEQLSLSSLCSLISPPKYALFSPSQITPSIPLSTLTIPTAACVFSSSSFASRSYSSDSGNTLDPSYFVDHLQSTHFSVMFYVKWQMLYMNFINVVTYCIKTYWCCVKSH